MKNVQDIFDTAKHCNGIRATIDRFCDKFDTMDHDNSFNWCDEYNYPTFEVRYDEKKGLYFIWIANDQDCDPRCDTYLDENCIIFTDVDDFYDFIDEVKEPVEE